MESDLINDVRPDEIYLDAIRNIDCITEILTASPSLWIILIGRSLRILDLKNTLRDWVLPQEPVNF